MAEWIEAVKEVAREAALARGYEHLRWPHDRALPFAYRWEHVQQVVRNGEWLLGQVDADPEVVRAACWLHDVKKGEPKHAERGAEFALTFLRDTDFPREKIEAVANAIAQHEGLWRASEGWSAEDGTPFRPAPPLQPLEAAVLWDADKLSKIGPIGFLHFLPQHILELQVEGESNTTEGLVSRNGHWLDTIAPRTIASFNTLPAQQTGAELHAAYLLFWKSGEAALQMGRA